MTLHGTSEACPYTPLGLALRAARDRRGLSRADLGRRLGFPRNRLVSVERGLLDLPVRHLLAILDALDPTTPERDELVDAWVRLTRVFTFLPTNPEIARAMGVLAVHGEELTPAALREIVDVARPRRQGRMAS